MRAETVAVRRPPAFVVLRVLTYLVFWFVGDRLTRDVVLPGLLPLLAIPLYLAFVLVVPALVSRALWDRLHPGPRRG